MNKDNTYKLIQKYLESVPLILVGTGGTIPLGVPGMSELANYLITKLDSKYNDDEEWKKLVEKMKKGIDLESAMTNIYLKNEIIEDIKLHTWKLITEADLNLLMDILSKNRELPLSRLLKKLYQAHPKCINIITTNYDRMIEYASDIINIRNNTRFNGSYVKFFSTNKMEKKEIINILKVHGSLDTFKNDNNIVYSIPLQSKIPNGFSPDIITPGSGKYRSVLQGTCRQLLHEADDLIDNAKCFLCIGYGFNDEQIQSNIIKGIKIGKPIVVVTKSISDKALDLIRNNSSNYVIIQESKSNTTHTEFICKNGIIQFEGNYWSIDGFMEIIGG